MAQVVQPDRRQASAAGEGLEALVDPLRAHRLAVLLREDVSGVLPAVAPLDRFQAVADRRAVAKLQTPMQRAGLDTSHLETTAERAGRVTPNGDLTARLNRGVSRGSMVPLEIDGVITGYTKAAV